MDDFPIDPVALLRPRRKIVGMSAILLPFDETGTVDWPGFRAHVERTFSAGLIPAINMDTGFASLIDDATRRTALVETRAIAVGREFVAGAFVGDSPGATLAIDAYRTVIDEIQDHCGLPIVFQSFGLTGLQGDALLDAYRSLGRDCPRYLAFELGSMFAPFGRIYDLATYAGLLEIRSCIGAKHSSLDRVAEWRRLMLRDRIRPDFLVLTGNDLAIDMVCYGSDYLLGLSTFAPDLFARRDTLWQSGDPEFYQVNDLLQYLGTFAFREPVPAYKHSAAQFLKLRGWIARDDTHPRCPRRPVSDLDVLRPIAAAVDALCRR
jgi:dihydrodipicolinate synthase/N-acetylneuraminate lyase